MAFDYKKAANFRDFVDSYVSAALWSSDDGEGKPLDDQYSASDLSASLSAKMKKDCAEFIAKAEDAGLLKDGDDYSQAGHDFWLTRGRYGAGFGDGYWKARGPALMELAKKWHEVDLYVSRGKIHGD